MLELKNISALTPETASRKSILHDVSCRFEAGQITAIVGPNGAGKTTLMRAAAGLVPLSAGSIYLEGCDWKDPKTRARHSAYLPQFQNLAWPLSCHDVVALGLLPYGFKDDALVAAALERCEAAHFSDRPIDTLSGGERSRVFVARLLVGNAPLLLLDEPTQSLDAAAAMAMMHLLRGAADDGAAIGVVMHDLNLARAFCDHVLVLQNGVAMAQGAPHDVFTPSQLEPIFKVEFDAMTVGDAHYLMPRS
ncbi:MAG: ABC transporter ATP-binding protein [Alphaproteobacteria bacterium]|nr:ABC transporter ATP-binding protein [Alphaproteobacteria bacterium]